MLYTSVECIYHPVIKLEQERARQRQRSYRENWDWKITRYEVCVSTGTERYAESHIIDFRFAYADCSDSHSDAKASREMARQLSDAVDAQTNIPRVGIGAADYRDITWEPIDIHDIDLFVAVLYEVNKLDDELLRSLIRAKKSGKSDAYSAVVHTDSRRVIG